MQASCKKHTIASDVLAHWLDLLAYVIGIGLSMDRLTATAWLDARLRLEADAIVVPHQIHENGRGQSLVS